SVGADGVGRDGGPLDERVGIEVADVAVFEGARLALVGVDAQVAGLGVVLGNEAPLEPGGKPGAPAAAQVALLHGVDELGGLQRHRLLETLVAAVGLVARQRPGIGGLPATADDLFD